MSTGLNCELIEVTYPDEPARWYYVLEDGSAPKRCWDWHEYARAYGPFKSDDEAYEHLAANHANPGGSSTTRMTIAELAVNRTLFGLLADAPENMKYTRIYTG